MTGRQFSFADGAAPAALRDDLERMGRTASKVVNRPEFPNRELPTPVRWRGIGHPAPSSLVPHSTVLPLIDAERPQLGLSFLDAEDRPIRLILSDTEAALVAVYVAEALGCVSLAQLRMISQSPRSDESPSDAVSVPQDGENVCPPARSSTACAGEM